VISNGTTRSAEVGSEQSRKSEPEPRRSEMTTPAVSRRRLSVANRRDSKRRHGRGGKGLHPRFEEDRRDLPAQKGTRSRRSHQHDFNSVKANVDMCVLRHHRDCAAQDRCAKRRQRPHRLEAAIDPLHRPEAGRQQADERCLA